MTATLPESKLTKKQVKTYGPKIFGEGKSQFRIVAEVRYDDECDNGHNSFGITATIEEKRGNKWRDCSWGCCHDEVAKHFPELAPFIKWHLFDAIGPMHYVANTVYHAGNRNLVSARSCAVWLDATDEQLCSEPEELKRLLLERLPALIEEFKIAVESLGFVF